MTNNPVVMVYPAPIDTFYEKGYIAGLTPAPIAAPPPEEEKPAKEALPINKQPKKHRRRSSLGRSYHEELPAPVEMSFGRMRIKRDYELDLNFD
jgi:hypothetical protein